MTLRADIEAAIAVADSSQEAALNVCVLLEYEMGLSGDGWFDDDKEFLNIAEERIREADEVRIARLRAERKTT